MAQYRGLRERSQFSKYIFGLFVIEPSTTQRTGGENSLQPQYESTTPGYNEEMSLFKTTQKASVTEEKQNFQNQKWKQALQKVKGIWKDRQDLPDFEQLREEGNRNFTL